ncbi:MAG: 3-phosphoserine/phosphohydroxythreonine transaminase [Lentisphaeria bacterium]|nr:3-phosphoserine/phosphohydroxythreonine transaminase [Lentisphaeria bacterium]
MQVYNFNAGPAAMPREVILKAQAEFADYHGCGYSIIEESHRAAPFDEIIQAAEANLRKLLDIPENYDVLFLQGGASLQFAMIPMNLQVPGKKIGYADTGVWANKAIKEIDIQGLDKEVVFNGKDINYTEIQGIKDWKIDQDLAYFGICVNNTIYGTEYPVFPETGNVPLVADMSSDILSRKFDVKKFGLIFAGAQKNVGPAGLTLVIIRKDLAERCPANVPTMLRYSTHMEAKSLYNTPPTFAIYMHRLITDWMLENGGLDAMEKLDDLKAKTLYDFIDNSGFYRATAAPSSRSRMNVCFRLPTEDQEKAFIAYAKQNGLVGLKGHRKVGGCRASIYNAVPLAGVERLIEVMKDFQKQA